MKVKLLVPVKIDDSWHKIGEVVNLRKDEAERLIKLGAAEKPQDKDEEEHGQKPSSE